MKILVTGGAGFIGSHLVEELLNKGHKVVVIDNFDSFYSKARKIENIKDSLNLEIDLNNFCNNDEEKLKFLKNNLNIENYKLYIEDIRNYDGIKEIFEKEKPEYIVNLAALAGVRPSILNPLKYEEVNIKGFLNIMEICKDLNIKKVIQASSSSVYGNCVEDICSESTRVDKQISPYAATKKACEEFGHVYSHLYNIDMIQLRFFTVYGERMRPDLAIYKFVDKIINNQEITLFGDGSSSRDYTYVKDVVNGIYQALLYLRDNNRVYEIFNLGSCREIKLIDMLKIVEEEIQKEAKIKFIEKQAGDVDRTFANIEKAKKYLNYEVKTDFKQGIKNLVSWYKVKNKN